MKRLLAIAPSTFFTLMFMGGALLKIDYGWVGDIVLWVGLVGAAYSLYRLNSEKQED